MMVDLGLFVVFFSVVLIGFCLALVGLSETAPHDNHLINPSILHGRRLYGGEGDTFGAGDAYGRGGDQYQYAGLGPLGLGGRMLADAAASHVFDSRDVIREDFATRRQVASEATQVRNGGIE